MTDFWISVLLTALITIVTIVFDWVAAEFVRRTVTNRRAENILKSGLSAEEAQAQALHEFRKAEEARSSALVWGTDLAIVALSLDFAALGIWMHNKLLFPFFQAFNDGAISRETPVWFIVLGGHLALLLASVVFKHLRADGLKTLAPDPAPMFSWRWLSGNRWALASNSIGFIALLGSMLIITNSFPGVS